MRCIIDDLSSQDQKSQCARSYQWLINYIIIICLVQITSCTLACLYVYGIGYSYKPYTIRKIDMLHFTFRRHVCVTCLSDVIVYIITYKYVHRLGMTSRTATHYLRGFSIVYVLAIFSLTDRL